MSEKHIFLECPCIHLFTQNPVEDHIFVFLRFTLKVLSEIVKTDWLYLKRSNRNSVAFKRTAIEPSQLQLVMMSKKLFVEAHLISAFNDWAR